MKDNVKFVVLLSFNVSLTIWLALGMYGTEVGVLSLSALSFMGVVNGWIIGLFVAHKLNIKLNSDVIHREGDRVIEQVRETLREERERDPHSLDWLKRGDHREQ